MLGLDELLPDCRYRPRAIPLRLCLFLEREFLMKPTYFSVWPFLFRFSGMDCECGSFLLYSQESRISTSHAHRATAHGEISPKTRLF